jgi:hypothetical protein
MGNSQEEIQFVMQRVMDNLKDAQTKDLKRLLRNLNNIFPLRIEDVDAQKIRTKLFTSLYNTNNSLIGSGAGENTKNIIHAIEEVPV